MEADGASDQTLGQNKRVLSIQSHVVHGYVGNKSAVFPLQLCGFDVDSINSVQFSNHTGYAKGVKGDILNGDQLLNLVQGLHENSLLGQTSHLLTGYIGSVSFLEAVVSVRNQLKAANPNLIYVCDPVLGDNGKLYVPEELVAVYRASILGIATVLTPNQFECEQLTGRTITNVEEAVVAVLQIHSYGPEIVIITSLDLPGQQDNIVMLASKMKDGISEMHVMNIPKLEGAYTGTGDLTAALFLARLSDTPELGEAMRKVAASVASVVERTLKTAGPGAELKLIQSKADIENPSVARFTAVRVEQEVLDRAAAHL